MDDYYLLGRVWLVSVLLYQESVLVDVFFNVVYVNQNLATFY